MLFLADLPLHVYLDGEVCRAGKEPRPPSAHPVGNQDCEIADRSRVERLRSLAVAEPVRHRPGPRTG